LPAELELGCKVELGCEVESRVDPEGEREPTRSISGRRAAATVAEPPPVVDAPLDVLLEWHRAR